jgi:hypothetical protein
VGPGSTTTAQVLTGNPPLKENAMAGKGKPSKGTPKDMRLKANQPKKAAPKAAALKFGSPAWRAKYGK